jgi:hypothetical protein
MGGRLDASEGHLFKDKIRLGSARSPSHVVADPIRAETHHASQ